MDKKNTVRPKGVVNLFEGDDHMIGFALINFGY